MTHIEQAIENLDYDYLIANADERLKKQLISLYWQAKNDDKKVMNMKEIDNYFRREKERL